MGAERRRDPRIRCSIACELRVAGQTFAGKVCNVSASGLGIVAEAPEADQGDAVGVTLRMEGLAIEVRAFVWHVRMPNRAAGDKAARVFGLVLSDPAPEFAALVGRLGAKRPSETPKSQPPSTPTPARAAASLRSVPGAIKLARPVRKAATSKPLRLREYRIRIKQNGGPRTCQIVASGVSQEAAVAAALSEVGPGWIALEVTPIP